MSSRVLAVDEHGRGAEARRFSCDGSAEGMELGAPVGSDGARSAVTGARR